MTDTKDSIGLFELVEAYVRAQDPELSASWRAYHAQQVVAYEQALRVKVPRTIADFPADLRALHFLFAGTVQSLVQLRHPLGGALEMGLLFMQLERAGPRGGVVLQGLEYAGTQVSSLRSIELQLLADLMVLACGRVPERVPLAQVRSNSAYPQSTPPRDEDW